MQYSSNSDEAVRSLIRALPTLAGQFRQATLHKRDREAALKKFRLALAKSEQQLIIRKARKSILSRNKPEDPDEQIIWGAKAALADLAVQEMEQELAAAAELVEDCDREIAVCDSEIERIRQQHGQNLGELPSAEFQELMGRDYKLRKARFLAARLISPYLQLPPDACETILELPVEQIPEYMQLMQTIAAPFIAAHEQREQKSLNGHVSN